MHRAELNMLIVFGIELHNRQIVWNSLSQRIVGSFDWLNRNWQFYVRKNVEFQLNTH